MKTIAQLAGELGVTKPAIRRYLTAEVRKHFAETVSGVIYISEQGESLIKSKIYKNKLEAYAETVSDLVSTLQKELEVKNKQLAVKDEQLKAKDRQNAEQIAIIRTLTESLRPKPPGRAYARKKLIPPSPKSGAIRRLFACARDGLKSP